jgi:hypothetical protein
MTRSQRLEGVIVFLLLAPFYLFLLQADGLPRRLGFIYLAAVCGYMVFASPNAGKSPSERRSLLDAAAVVCWILFCLWGIIPLSLDARGWLLPGRMPVLWLGIVGLGAALYHIVRVSAGVHGDTAADWGLGSPRCMLRALRDPERRGAAWATVAGANLAGLAFCLGAGELSSGIAAKALRQILGLRLQADPPPLATLLLFLFAVNLAVFFVIRYDNLKKASRLTGVYLCVVLPLMTLGALWLDHHLRVRGLGRLEVDVSQGLRGIGTYLFWGTLQQTLFMGYFNTRIRKGMRSPLLSALLTGVVFSLFHLTGYALTAVCFFIGTLWALLFQAAPNVFCLGAAHGLSAGFAAAFVPRLAQGVRLISIKAAVGPFNP